MLDLQRLQTFRKVATLRSFSAAALELSYTQSSVSESVATLERELGVTLLDRSSRPVRLTPSGELVLAHAETLLTEATAIQTDLAALTRGDVGRLRLGGSTRPGPPSYRRQSPSSRMPIRMWISSSSSSTHPPRCGSCAPVNSISR